MAGRTRQRLARVGAPLALLAAVTLGVLLVRAGLNAEPPADVSATTAVTTTATGPGATGTVPTDTRGAQFYTIRRGDTLETVAERYGTSVESLLALNPGIDPVQLTVGQRIRVA